MKTNIVIFSLIFLQCISIKFIFGQAEGNVRYRDNSSYGSIDEPDQKLPIAHLRGTNFVELETNVLMNVKATSYLAIFHLEQRGKELETVQKNLDKRISTFKEELKKLGFEEKDIVIDFISLVPEFEYEIDKKIFSRTYNETPKGFELKKNIHIHFKNSQLLDQIIEKAAQSEIYDLAKVEYFVENTDSIYQQLRKKAFDLVKEKEKSYVASTIKLNEAEKIADEAFQAYFPPTRYRSYEAISQGKTSFSKNAKINYHNHSPSSFYEKLDYDRIECIINAEIVEPAVQFYFTLKVRYVLPPKEKEIYILTPDGNLKKVSFQN